MTLTSDILKFSWLVTGLIPRFHLRIGCGFLFGPPLHHRHLFPTQKSAMLPIFWGRGWFRIKLVKRGKYFGMITTTMYGSCFPHEIILLQETWLLIFPYSLKILSLGRGICQSQRGMYWHLWILIIYVLELVQAHNFDYEMANLSLETEILEKT